MSQPLNPNSGGVQMTTFKLATFFHQSGLEVHTISLAQKGHTMEYPGFSHSMKASGSDQNQKNLLELSRLIGNIQPEVVINQVPYLAKLRFELAKLKRAHGFKLYGCLRSSLFKYIDNIQEIIDRTFPKATHFFLKNQAIAYLLKWQHIIKHKRELHSIFKCHDKFILLGNAHFEELEYFVATQYHDRCEVIPNSIPKVDHELSRKEKLVLYVGGISIPHKRSDLLLPIWKKVLNELPDWKFEIVGSGTYLKELQQQIVDEKIERVQVLGRQVPDDYYQRASIFLMTSEKEGFPNVLVEAQSFGAVPIVFESYRLVKELIDHGKTGYLIEPFKVESFACQLIELAKSKDLLETNSKSALMNAERFTIEKVGQDWMELFHKDLNR
ncbi:MAG: glycosyltransferase [Cyclobacteriaceae bacterium]|nr:glycosyltransferase [Cyclobacteriaceae bacterium]MCH8516918.1 glycosyltransferase [Cyclobacteriaceae bacterium]